MGNGAYAKRLQATAPILDSTNPAMQAAARLVRVFGGAARDPKATSPRCTQSTRCALRMWAKILPIRVPSASAWVFCASAG